MPESASFCLRTLRDSWCTVQWASLWMLFCFGYYGYVLSVGVIDGIVLFGLLLLWLCFVSGSHWWHCFVWVIIIMVMFCQRGVTEDIVLFGLLLLWLYFVRKCRYDWAVPSPGSFIYYVWYTGTHLFDLGQRNILIIKQRWFWETFFSDSVNYESSIWWGKKSTWWEILEAVHHCERQKKKIYEGEKRRREKWMADKRERRRKTIDLFIRCALQREEVLESQIFWPPTHRSWLTACRSLQ